MAAEGITKGVDLAARLGKDAGEVSRYLALAELAPEVQEKLGRPNFSMAHRDATHDSALKGESP